MCFNIGYKIFDPCCFKSFNPNLADLQYAKRNRIGLKLLNIESLRPLHRH